MAKLYILEKKKKSHIQPEVYGHFSEHLGRGIYGGIFVGEDSAIPNVNGMRKDVVDALKEIRVPVLRWPGGCFADEYHWMDGIGPKESRKKMVNTHWGGVVEDNSFGTHEYFELCEQLGCKSYVNGNVGSGSVREMSEWVEYITFPGVSPMADLRGKNGREKAWKLDYFGVGNESWGCGGNMTPEYYGNLYRRYQTFVRDYNAGEHIRKIACGPNVDDYQWTEELLKVCFDRNNHGFMNGLSLHYYVVPHEWNKKGSATQFTAEEWYLTLHKALYMEELIRRHGAIMDRFDPEKKVGLMVDEWGAWYDVEPGTNPGFLYQQSTMRDALVAAVTLNIFNKHSDRVKMACIAQMVNVLQSVLLTEGDRMVKTPTYHVFHMYRHHQDADLLESWIDDAETAGTGENQVPCLQESVSVDQDGVMTVTVANLSLEKAKDVELVLTESVSGVAEARILTGAMNGANTFEEPEQVTEQAFAGVTVSDGSVRFTIPPCAVVSLRLEQ